MSQAKQLSPKEFTELYCDLGGIRLRFDGSSRWNQLVGCSQYIENHGCSIHTGRPLACRLFPLGRQIQNQKVSYIYRGNEFPCLQGCPEVLQLPHITVDEYLQSQDVHHYMLAQDEYLEVVQNIAESAFILLLETQQNQEWKKKTLQVWKSYGDSTPELLNQKIPPAWLEELILPKIFCDPLEPQNFVRQHEDLLLQKAQSDFESLSNSEEIRSASAVLLAVALQLGQSVGADPKTLAQHWVGEAKKHAGIK